MSIDRPHAAPAQRLTVLSGPSGVGKGSVKALIQEYYPWVWLSVSCTTRKPRPGEVDGADYHFVSTDQFESMIAAGEFLEWASYAGNLYGTPRGPVDAQLRAGLPAATRGAAVLIVAQRVATIREADEILVLDEGRVVGLGTHDELMAGNDTYREIVLSQLSAQEAA